MNRIDTTLKNFSFIKNINTIFPNTNGHEYTKKDVIRLIKKPICSCGRQSLRNGWDKITRKNIFTLKIGKFICPKCEKTIRSDLSFWEKLIEDWNQSLSSFFLRLHDRDVALRVISDLMNFLTPMSKDSVLRKICQSIKQLIIPKIKCKYQIIHYDEQHPKKGRQQKYRLTLICAITGKVIADELTNNMNKKTVKNFLKVNLNINKEVIMITDGLPWYPELFKEIWGKKVKHQMCILHLNKLIVSDCGKIKSLQEMYNTYLLLNIFLNRKKELEFIQMLIEEEKIISEQKYNEWIKHARNRFNKFVRSLEKMRRRDKLNHTLYSLEESKINFSELKNEIWLLDKPLQKRLKYIEKFWNEFSLFHQIDDCPHTNNVIENYFSSSLKTHRKKQFRTDKGLENKIKLSHYKRNIGFENPIKTFLEWGKIFGILNPT